ncbi:MAG TPA: glycosyltransferase family 39 protein [Vicinamibacterales bacterium]|nr:glycosyltransferase family 39 protein [Vicinamibacterales bacterium]
MWSAGHPRERAITPVVWALLALALALRLWFIADKNLWLDESVSWQFATGSIGDLIHGTAGDIHPPLYYLLLKVWVAICGDSLAGLRTLSVVFGVAAVYVLFRLLDGTPRLTAYAAMFWFAVAPHAVLFSQEARMYAAVTLCVLAVCLCYRRWIDSGFTSGRALASYAAFVVVCLYLHYFTSLVVAAISLHALLLAMGAARRPTDSPRRLPLTTWIAVHLGIGLAYLPWVAIAASQISHGQSWRETMTVANIPALARDMFAGLLGGLSSYSFDAALPWVAIAVLVVGLSRLALTAFRGPEPERDLFFLIVALVPIGLGLALQPFAGRMDLARYLPYSLPLLIAASARGLATVRMPGVAAAAVLAVGALATVPALQTYYRTHTKDSDARPIVAALMAAAQAGGGTRDVIFVAPGYMDAVVQYISRGALVYQRVPDDADDLLKAIEPALGPSHATWVIVDYRWPAFKDLGNQPRLREEAVPFGHPDQIKLFRVY